MTFVAFCFGACHAQAQGCCRVFSSGFSRSFLLFVFGQRFLLALLLKVFSSLATVPAGFTPEGFSSFEESSCWVYFLGFWSSAKGSCWVYSVGLSSLAKGSCGAFSFGLFVYCRRVVLGLLLRVFVFGQKFVLGLLPRVVVFGQRFLRGLLLRVVVFGQRFLRGLLLKVLSSAKGFCGCESGGFHLTFGHKALGSQL